MPAQDNARIGQGIFEAYNKRDFDAAAKLVSEGHEAHDMTMGEILHGPDGVKTDLERWARAFPDSSVEIVRAGATQEGAVVEFTGRGTHTGPLDTPTGSIPATNKKVELSYCVVMEIRNGLITSQRRYWDANTLMRQLGLAPEQAAVPAAGAKRS